ncbi:hypothetical protein SPRG_10638 [Saprolegnia parasitica CBS 223.65]|uniref:Choline transporter-like protein n=1 Tax=Saprolegnia parasitica (strain CBS 223.65) TaxID=695850 RepID=A0A067C0D7_SAPPC|nr:hypothetical protein SPRG_10638 [Saprolegnia parasitica CBS 223.65]KDO24209.1 hypothetical protein SPRG_10638 [Saprolegnia parasitica CBS 223.65]|eukprot:XP_012205153.1 hypothetical protein SPRG_10638 [Saprolegnia parasitica CBS 223.65]
MKGGSFCHAIVDAFNLVAANLGRIGTQSIVATYVLFMGKLLITALCVLGMYAFEASHASLHLTSPFPPLIATGLLAYAISCLFLGDEKINRSTGQYYATPEVRSFLDDSAKFAFKHHLPDGQDASV